MDVEGQDPRGSDDRLLNRLNPFKRAEERENLQGNSLDEVTVSSPQIFRCFDAPGGSQFQNEKSTQPATEHSTMLIGKSKRPLRRQMFAWTLALMSKPKGNVTRHARYVVQTCLLTATALSRLQQIPYECHQESTHRDLRLIRLSERWNPPSIRKSLSCSVVINVEGLNTGANDSSMKIEWKVRREIFP